MEVWCLAALAGQPQLATFGRSQTQFHITLRHTHACAMRLASAAYIWHLVWLSSLTNRILNEVNHLSGILLIGCGIINVRIVQTNGFHTLPVDNLNLDKRDQGGRLR